MTLDITTTTSLEGDLSLDDQDLEAMSSRHYQFNHKSSSSSFRINVVPDIPLTERDILGRQETRRVYWIKAMVIGLFTVVAISVSIVLFLHVKRQERTRFQRHYYDTAQRIVTTVQENVQRHTKELENLSMYIQSLTKIEEAAAAAAASSSSHYQPELANDKKESGTGGNSTTTGDDDVVTSGSSSLSWPFVTVPDFDLISASTRHMGMVGSGDTTTTTTNKLLLGLGLTLISVVQPSQRQAYEAYSVQHQEWIHEGLERQAQMADGGGGGAVVVVASSSSSSANAASASSVQLFPPFIYHDTGSNGDGGGGPVKEDDLGPGPYFPIRHLVPLTRPELVNFNVAANTSSNDTSSSASQTTAFGEAVWEAYHSGKVVLGKILLADQNDNWKDNKDDYSVQEEARQAESPLRASAATTTTTTTTTTSAEPDSSNSNNKEEDDVMTQWLQESLSSRQERYRNKTNNHLTVGPVSSLYYPILVDDVVVGLLTDFMAWSSLLSNIVSPSDDGDGGGNELYYLVVLENSCSPHTKYSFHLKGSTVEMYSNNEGDDDDHHDDGGGGGDAHDPTYDSMQYSYRFDFLEQKGDDDSYFNTILPPRPSWNTEYCPYTLHVYPTATLEDSYYSKLPLVYTLAVALVYVVATMMFLIYDCVVEQRQQKVLKVALESRAIVQTLFPPVVRERLFAQQRKVTGRVRTMLQNTMRGGGAGGSGSAAAASGRRVGSTTTVGSAGGVGGSSIITSGRTSSGARSSANTTTSILGSRASRASVSTLGDGAIRSSGHGSSGGSDVRQVSFRLGDSVNSPGGRGAPRVSNLELEEGDLTNYDESHRRGDEDDPLTMYAPKNNSNSNNNKNMIGPGTLPLRSRMSVNRSTARLKSFLSVCEDSSSLDFKPIADMFPHTTVLFGDIVGFTSWSSQREPEKVFTLLQAIFNAFDMAARKRAVFKVETIGDCYVAVTGLPDPQEDHAWRMCKFALECRSKMTDVTRDLEVSLGPDTGDLTMRFGIHSGAVTGGILLGEKSRFQLFGDTVNTASRMESTGERSRIQMSQSTADRLTATGKGAWIRPRDEKIKAKGKGLLQTYWLASRPHVVSSSMPNRRSSLEHLLEKCNEDILNRRSSFQNDLLQLSGSLSGQSSNTDNEESANRSTCFDSRSDLLSEDQNRRRVINWQSELLLKTLKLIVAHRVHKNDSADMEDIGISGMKGSIVLDEVVESIALPKFDAETFHARRDPSSVVLSEAVVSQLHDYVSTIAGMYVENAFHNFEHASHVAMSASVLLHRFIDPECEDVKMAEELHDLTDGINSDPLTQFAVVFSALIHDVDHGGIPNEVLAKEDPTMAEMYRHQSIAEQKSVDIAWELLMDSAYDDLRACIYSNQTELNRFRQLVVNCVMATDLFNEEKQLARDARWAKYFPDALLSSIGCSTPPSPSLTRKSSLNPRATLMIEHILQAADVAHTMQHWHIFTKWNERLFEERCAAYESGRSGQDPAKGWYESELNFFDNYVIPLARKLQACEAFGVASNECLSYAMDNRDEWAGKGETHVLEMIEHYQKRKKALERGQGLERE